MSESLREQLAANLDKIVTRDEEAAQPPAAETPPAATPSGETGAARPSSIAEAPKAETRARDPETGKFIEAPKEKPTAAAPARAPTPTPPSAGTPAQAAAAVPPKPKPARPDSWKKDYWPHWEKLVSGQPLTAEEALALAEYTNTRETDFRHGVSAYKREWDNARPVLEAMQPFLPLLQQHGIQPAQWVSNLGAAHRELALGTPQQKLARFAWLAQQYGVPVAALTDQAAQQQYLAQGAQGQNFQGALPPNVLTREEADKLFQERFNAVRSQEDIQAFAADAEKHPHFEAVRETMAQLLDSGLAENLTSAYDAALRLPQHSALWQQLQEQERARAAEENAKAEAERLAKAKGKAVSVRSATPSAPAGEKPKDRRSTLEAAFDEHMGAGRV